MIRNNALTERICSAQPRLAAVDRRPVWARLYGWAALLLLLTVLGAAEARGETVVYGRVVAVEPLHTRHADGPATGAGGCAFSVPTRAAGLIARLRWDHEQRAIERSRCLAQRAPELYRVTYQWNGQLFTQELPFEPGERIALRMDVR